MTDSTSLPPIYTPATLKSPRRPLVIAILAGFGLFWVAGGSGAIYLSFCSDLPRILRGLLLLTGAALLFWPVTFLAVLVRRKLTSGRWTLTQEERVEHFKKAAAKPRSRAFTIVSSPWFGRASNVFTIAVAGIMIWSAYRGGFHAFNVILAAFWVGLAWQAVANMKRQPVMGAA